MIKTILITGASKGIGKRTAALLATDGHQLVLGSRNTSPLKEIQAQYPDQIILQDTDVTVKAQVMALAETAVAKFGKIDVRVNNAGLGHFDLIAEANTDDWDQMIDVNLKGALYAIHSVLPGMLAKEKGQIINIASVAGHHIFPRSVVYCATKHAIRAISEGLRLENQDKIRITTISPGAVNTSFAENISNENIRKEFKSYMAGGLTANTVAKAIKQCIDYPENVTMTEMIIRPKR